MIYKLAWRNFCQELNWFQSKLYEERGTDAMEIEHNLRCFFFYQQTCTPDTLCAEKPQQGEMCNYWYKGCNVRQGVRNEP